MNRAAACHAACLKRGSESTELHCSPNTRSGLKKLLENTPREHGAASE